MKPVVFAKNIFQELIVSHVMPPISAAVTEHAVLLEKMQFVPVMRLGPEMQIVQFVRQDILLMEQIVFPVVINTVVTA